LTFSLSVQYIYKCLSACLKISSSVIHCSLHLYVGNLVISLQMYLHIPLTGILV
jgi:hypothetical protein